MTLEFALAPGSSEESSFIELFLQLDDPYALNWRGLEDHGTGAMEQGSACAKPINMTERHAFDWICKVGILKQSLR